MQKLSKRMQAVADMVDRGSCTADVGCDHGFVSIYLVQSGICEKVYAADVRPGPLSRAQEHIAQNGLTEQITTILSDGLEKVPADADTAVIAGMGGPLICRILENELPGHRAVLVLEPQSETAMVRSWLADNGYAIVKECIVEEEGKFYPVIKAIAGTEEPEETIGVKHRWQMFSDRSWKEIALHFGPAALASPDETYLTWIRSQITAKEKLINSVPPEAAQQHQDVLTELKLVLEFLT